MLAMVHPGILILWEQLGGGAGEVEAVAWIGGARAGTGRGRIFGEVRGALAAPVPPPPPRGPCSRDRPGRGEEGWFPLRSASEGQEAAWSPGTPCQPRPVRRPPCA